MARQRRVVLLPLGAAAAVLLIALPMDWWTLTRDAGESQDVDGYGPFDDADAPGDAAHGPVLVLGLLVVAALLAGTWALVEAWRRRTIGGATILAFFLALAAVLYPVWSFPGAASEAHGDVELDFRGSECRPVFAVILCYRTAPDLGWFLATASATLLLAAWIMALLSRRPAPGLSPAPVATPAPAPVPHEPAAPPLVSEEPRVPAPPVGRGIPPGTTIQIKCPQCQTKLSATRQHGAPTLVDCPNCGRRVRA